MRDLRYGARRCCGPVSPPPPLTLALGIGANTAIFSVVTGAAEAAVIVEPDRLAFVWERNTTIGKDRDFVAAPNYLDWKAQNAVFEALGAYRTGGFAMTGAGEPESVTAIFLSSSMFRVLGVEPLVEGTYTEEEEEKKDRVVVPPSRFLAATLRRRSRYRRQIDHPGRHAEHRDRGDAARLPFSGRQSQRHTPR